MPIVGRNNRQLPVRPKGGFPDDDSRNRERNDNVVT